MKPNKSQLAEVPPAQQKRKARIQPHTLLGVAVSCLAAGAFAAYAATGGSFSFTKSSSIKSSVPMKSRVASTTAKNAGGKAQLLGQTSGSKKGGFMLTQTGGGFNFGTQSIVGTGESGNNLTEVDLTANTASDERDASFSPNGQYVAFRSNGVDANGDAKLDATGLSPDGKYHIWVGKLVNNQSGGSPSLDVYKVTGQNAQYLSGFDQLRPTWSTNSRELAFVSNSSISGSSAASGEQIYRIDLNLQNTGIPQPSQPYNLTNFAGPKRSPVWSLNGTEIIFAAKSNVLNGTANSYDLFRISSNGQATLFTRITGNLTIDAAGAAVNVDDLNPVISLTQQNVVYFSSNRIAGEGRRIYAVRTDGTGLVQVTDPSFRPYGQPTDNDDFPAISTAGVGGSPDEVLAFQSNSLIDSSDTFKDRNIWGISVDSSLLGGVVANAGPRFFVSAYNGNQVDFVIPPSGTTPSSKFNVESGANLMPRPEGLVYYQNNIYVSSRTRNRVERLDANTGAPKPAAGLGGSAFTPADIVIDTTTLPGRQVPNPAGLAIFGNYLYVVSGTDITNAVYRYDISTGNPQGITVPATQTAPSYRTARFTYGEPTAKPLGSATDVAVSEGIAINKAGTRLYVSNFVKNRINIYTLVRFTTPVNGPFNAGGQTSKTFNEGEWLGEIVAPQLTSNVNDPDAPGQKMELKGPTGIAIGPSINGDGIDDLYVSSSLYNDVLAFALTANGDTQAFPDSSQFKAVVTDNDISSNTNLSSPEGLRFDENGTLYVSSYGGTSVNRYTKSGTTWTVAGLDPLNLNNAAWITNINGPSYFDFNPLFADNYVDINTGSAGNNTFTGEENGSAYLITNILSSPANYAASDLSLPTYNSNGVALPVNVTEDRSADIEASFGRDDASNASLQNRVRVVFSSNRKFAGSPSSNAAGATASNPNGGNDNETGLGDPPTNCDLWITSSSDIEAPVIQPEQNNYPMLSPTHESGNFVSNPDIGPRTARGGLSAGGFVKLALLAKEKGSGLSQVSFAFYNPEDPRRFETQGPGGNYINESKIGVTQREVDPSDWPAVTGFDFDDPGMSLNLVNPSTGAPNAPTSTDYYSDQGPRGTNPERQSNAVAGDGIYYLAKTINAPSTVNDYYISIRLKDRSGNFSFYYFVWGFSTKNFAPSTSNDIFVSDNTAGQEVYIYGRDSVKTRISPPVESFYLSNWGPNTNSTLTFNAGSIGTIVNGQFVPSATSNPETFTNVDVWRVLCRGPIDEDIVSTNYIPSTITQINPDKFTNGFQVKDKVFANVQRVVLWAAPYAGTAEVEFDLPGSIKEGATKQQLKRLLAGGGRLFLTGRNVLTALDEGGADNSFRSEELYATANGKVGAAPLIANAVNPTSGTNAFPELDLRFLPPLPRVAYSDLQFGWVPNTAPAPDDYRDSSYSHANFAGVVKADTYQAGTGTGVQIFQAYTSGDTTGNKPFGQRIIKKRGTSVDSGLESRVVFFPFNFDGVNRRFGTIPNNVPHAFNVRKDIADGIRTWFKTGTFNGTVVDNTGALVVNALVAVQAGTDVYYARTDANGFYELKGLPAGRVYSAFFVFNDKTFAVDTDDNDANDRDDLPADDVNRNYFSGTGSAQYLYAGATADGNEVRVQKISPGSVTGRVYTYSGSNPTDNPINRALHTPIGGIQVLLTVVPTSTTSTAPVYARVVRTAATGEFSFADAPAGRNLQLILNPKPTDVPAGSDLTNPNDPNDTTIVYDQEYGRRVIPLNGDKRRKGDIVAVQNDVFVVNDTYVYDPSKTDLASYPIPTATDTKNDEKDANGNSLPVVLTRGEPISGTFTLVAGVDAPRFGAGWQIQLIPVGGGATRQTVTNADGTYTFDEVINGTYNIVGTVPASFVNGYDQLTARLDNVNTLALTDIEKSSQNLKATIAHIVGAVKVNSQFISGATVTLQRPDGTPVVFGTSQRKGTTGNVSGGANYFIGYVPVGVYKLVAQLPNGGPTLVRDPVEILPTTTVQVEDFVFAVSEIKVNVTTLYPAISKAGVTVEAFNTNAPNTVAATGTTDVNGVAVFTGLSDGTYTFKASKTEFDVSAMATSPNVTVTQVSLPDVNLTLKWDSLKGVVKVNNQPRSGAKIQFFLNGSEITGLATTTASNGTYEAGKNSGSTIARPLAPGLYTIRASIVSNGLALSRQQTYQIGPVINGQIISLPDFNFTESYLTGVVRFNNQPSSGFEVKLYNADGTVFKDINGVERTATTNASGVYRLNSVPIGTTTYIIRATKLIGATTATGEISVSSINEGVTTAPDILINISGGIRGQVKVNGEGAPAARLEVLTSKKKSLVPAVIVTADASGNYFITGLPISSSSVTYYLKASYNEGGRDLTPITKSFKVKNNIYTPATLNFDFKVTRLKGLVRANGTPAAGATVTLLDSKGKALKVPFTATTDDNGNYIMSGVKSGTYRVQATFAGATGFVTAKVGNLKTNIAPTIDLSAQELQVTTEFRVGNSKIGDAPGATVEILSSTGNALGSAFVKTTDGNSRATFFGLPAGNYRARVTLQGYTTTTNFSVTSGRTTVVLPITLSQVRDLLILSESNGMRTTELGGIDILRASLLVKPAFDVEVTLTANNPDEATFTTGNTVNLVFTSDNWNVDQSVTLVGQEDGVSDGDQPFSVGGAVSSGDSLFDQIPDFTLSGTNFESATIPLTGPTFPANSKNLVSTPFTDVDGNLSVEEAFGTSGYTLYRFNSAGQQNRFLSNSGGLGVDWIPMSASDNMERGRGYLLVTGNQPVTMLVPMDPTIFSGDTFAVTVVRNPNFVQETGNSNLNNGYDLIGFPFDPTTVSGYDILQQAQVLTEGVLYPSFLEAAAAGKISNRIYTVDNLGRPLELTPANSTVRPYRGYFVKIFTDSAKIILKANPSNGSSGSTSSFGASSAKTSSVKSF